MKKNKTAFCIASGTSLIKEDVDLCRGHGKIYVVKESAFMAPWADILYAADGDWWGFKDRWEWFEGEKYTVAPDAAKKYPCLNLLEYDTDIKWSFDQKILATGGNSGFQIINLAVLQGAETVILLGYDMGFQGQKHWWDNDHKRDCRPSDYNNWIARFNAAAPVIPAKVINCTRSTALNCFEKMSLEDAIKNFC